MDAFRESSPVTSCYPMFAMLNIDVTEKSKVPVVKGCTVRAKLGIIMSSPLNLGINSFICAFQNKAAAMQRFYNILTEQMSLKSFPEQQLCSTERIVIEVSLFRICNLVLATSKPLDAANYYRKRTLYVKISIFIGLFTSLPC